jgi:hypothetical protein
VRAPQPPRDERVDDERGCERPHASSMPRRPAAASSHLVTECDREPPPRHATTSSRCARALTRSSRLT